MGKKRVTVTTLLERKLSGRPVTMLTAYDSTLPVTMEDMIHNGSAVCQRTK